MMDMTGMNFGELMEKKRGRKKTEGIVRKVWRSRRYAMWVREMGRIQHGPGWGIWMERR
jgi:hypothetical protein